MAGSETHFVAVEGRLLWQIGSGVEEVTEQRHLLDCLPKSQSETYTAEVALRYDLLTA